MDKYCSNCGKELNENENICTNCGAKTRNNKADSFALAGFILGLVAIVAWIIPLFGYPIGICGIIFSAKGLKSSKNKNKATVGLILSIVFLSFTLVNSIAGVFINLSNFYDSIKDNFYHDHHYI